jgi:hypothetical protein
MISFMEYHTIDSSMLWRTEDVCSKLSNNYVARPSFKPFWISGWWISRPAAAIGAQPPLSRSPKACDPISALDYYGPRNLYT